mmetsp:Transcript_5582/g.8619  ORF Transcript_5582/g.8619 Transcript_5582/m.8619 type:complete len:114 (+) Transcript_5582:3324-3665(+)
MRGVSHPRPLVGHLRMERITFQVIVFNFFNVDHVAFVVPFGHGDPGGCLGCLGGVRGKVGGGGFDAEEVGVAVGGRRRALFFGSSDVDVGGWDGAVGSFSQQHQQQQQQQQQQ